MNVSEIIRALRSGDAARILAAADEAADLIEHLDERVAIATEGEEPPYETLTAKAAEIDHTKRGQTK